MSKPQPPNSAKFAFFYFIALISLIFVVTGAGNIIFELINKYVKDILTDFGYSEGALKFAISSLIIATPVFYLASSQINKNLANGKLDKDAGIRRWLTYLILLVSSVVTIGWLIGFIFSFLNGELSLKFALKTLTVLTISGILSKYYFWDIKREKIKEKDKTIKSFFIGSLSAIIIIFILGVLFVESPFETRKRKFDNLITNKFQKIDRSINEYYNFEKKLPKTLDDLIEETEYLDQEDVIDEARGEQFDYKIIEERKYEICANFNLASKEGKNYYLDEWKHEAGYQCLKKRIVEYKDSYGERQIEPRIPSERLEKIEPIKIQAPGAE